MDFINEHARDLPFQPLKTNSKYDNSYTASNPLKAAEITYNKRKGEAIYIYCNNPEQLQNDQLNKGIIRNQFSNKEVFFTMEHNSQVKKRTFIGYQVRNIGETDLYITIKNIGIHLGEGGWFGEKEWIDFYNSNFSIKNTYNKPYNIDDINGIKNKKVQNKYTHQKKSQTTYRIPPKKYINVLGGTSSDAYENINVFDTANQEFYGGIINGAVLFEVKGNAEGILFFYDDYKKNSRR